MDEKNIAKSEKELQEIKGKNSFTIRHKKILIFSVLIAAIGVAVGIAAVVDGINGIKALGDFVTNQILGMQ